MSSKASKTKGVFSLIPTLFAGAAVMGLLGWRYWSWVTHNSTTIDFGMDILTVVAFVLAFRAFFDAKSQGDRLATIYESVDTKYVGVFPKHLELLTRHVSHAKSFVCIVWDAVDIGSYVSPAHHNALVDALVEASARIGRPGQVRFLIWDEPQAISQAGAGQFDALKAIAFCQQVRSKEAFFDQIEQLLDKYNHTSTANTALTVKNFDPFRERHLGVDDFRSDERRRAFTIYQLCYHDYIAKYLENHGVEIRVLRELGEPPLPQTASQRRSDPCDSSTQLLPPANLF